MNSMEGTYVKHAKDSILTLLQSVDNKTILILGSNRRNAMILQELSSDFYNFIVDKSTNTIKYRGNTVILSSSRDMYAYMGMHIDYLYRHSVWDMELRGLHTKVFIYDSWS